MNPIRALNSLEKAVYSGDTRSAAGLLLNLLQAWADRGFGFSFRTGPLDDEQEVVFATRLAAAITTLFCNPSQSITQMGYEGLVRCNRGLVAIWLVSGFRGSQHLLNTLGTADSQGNTRYPTSELMKLLACSVPEQLPAQIIDQLNRQAVNLTVPFALSVLSQKQMLSPASEELRRQALKLAERIEDYPFSRDTLLLAIRAWMDCSYAVDENKHNIKANINRFFRRWMADNSVIPPTLPAQRAFEERPTILIAAERFDSTHAMYRCYASMIRALRQRFRLVLLSTASEIDEVNLVLFDHHLTIEDPLYSPQEWLKKAIAEKPDIIYFPSLGMSVWAVALANLRIAPIQIMSLGHPASSRSDCIDYVFTRVKSGGSPDCYTERLIYHLNAHMHTIRHDSEAVSPELRERPEVVRLAIPAWALKLNATFLDACQRITELSARPVEFHFFINLSGLPYLAMKRELESILPAVVYEASDYNTYIRNLNGCDIHLSSFPFGASNGNIDSARQGLPILCLSGPEPHSMIDLVISQQLGLPDWLRTHSVDEYVAAALRLIDDDTVRLEIGQQLLQSADAALFTCEETEEDQELAGIFWNLYQHHETIQQDPRRILTSVELDELAPDELEYL